MRLQPSATRAVSETAAALRARGVDVLSLSTGEPDFASPRAAFVYARKAMEAGRTGYTATAGIPELREEVAAYYANRFGLGYDSGNVMIGAGAKPLLFEAFAALLNPGDEVILTAPAWVSYVEQIRFFDAVPVILETDPRTLQFEMDAIEAAITPGTRAFVLNSPHNPSGVIFDSGDVDRLCRLALRHGFTVINDEVYERITFDGHDYRNPLCTVPEAREHVLNINAVSKTYAMTGWRIGFATGPSDLIARMSMLQGHLTSGAGSVAQWAALGAIREAQADVDAMSARYQARKELMTGLMDDMPCLRYVPPMGAFYVFADIRETAGRSANGMEIVDDVSFCKALLESGHLALVPGASFLRPGYVRISFAASEDVIREAMKRLQGFLSGL